MKEDEFKCAICNNIYKKGQSDEDANKEAKDIWGVENANNNENMEVICDDCFNRRTQSEVREMGNHHKEISIREKIENKLWDVEEEYKTKKLLAEEIIQLFIDELPEIDTLPMYPPTEVLVSRDILRLKDGELVKDSIEYCDEGAKEKFVNYGKNEYRQELIKKYKN